jgi:hypothetical protein
MIDDGAEHCAQRGRITSNQSLARPKPAAAHLAPDLLKYRP